MMDYKPNSNRFKKEQMESTERKKVEKVVTGVTRTKEKTISQKLCDIFISPDITDIKSFAIFEVIVPSINRAISDIVKNGVDMILKQYNPPRSRQIGASKINYSRISSETSRSNKRVEDKNVFVYDNIVFENRGDAEAVLSAMEDMIDQFGVVSVGDFYDLSEITTTNYTVNKYGWHDIRNAQVVRYNDGTYSIKLPKAFPLD